MVGASSDHTTKIKFVASLTEPRTASRVHLVCRPPRPVISNPNGAGDWPDALGSGSQGQSRLLEALLFGTVLGGLHRTFATLSPRSVRTPIALQQFEAQTLLPAC